MNLLSTQVEVKLFNPFLIEKLSCFDIDPVESTLQLPYKTPKAAAFDLHAIIDTPLELFTRSAPVLIPTGMGFQIHHDEFDFMIFLLIRSGLSTIGLALTNAIGLIDPDYQNQLFCSVINNNKDDRPYTIKPGERIAQAVIMPVFRMPTVKIVDEFSTVTKRGLGGFGHTGS
jgi:dUTP pyrophosphatase